jgi:type IV/VI secretion system ImpK/VasF family protein
VADHNLGRVAGDFFATVLLASDSSQGGGADPASRRAPLVSLLEAISHHPLALALEPQELEDSRFALVAWADETLIKGSWPGGNEWSQELLQFQLFRTMRGGDEFYDRLARLRPDQNAARGIFFLCFAFGFEGQMVGDEPRRQTVIQANYDMLRAAGYARDPISAGQLSPAAYDNLDIVLEPPSSGSLGRLLIRWGGAAALLFTLLWAVLTWSSSRVPLPPGA